MIVLNYSEIKSLITSGSIKYKHVEKPNKYSIFGYDGPFECKCEIYKDTDDATDYEANYKAPGSQVLKLQTPLGTPIIALKKPDGSSETLYSHNFCDKTTWPTETDSSWSVAPGAGKILKVIKAEVQFTHDVELKTLLPTAETLVLNVNAGGSPVDTVLFNSIEMVFNLGNKHYTMTETVDGLPGVTTVVFDYADSIVLKSSWGMSMEFVLQNHTELGGTFCTISLVTEEIDE